MWETTVMHKQVSGWTVNFGPNFPESPFLELKTRKPPIPPFQKTSDLGWPKFTLEYPTHFRKLQIWDDQSLLLYSRIPPHFGKLQIWDDQSLLTSPILENFRFGMTKVYSGIPHPISENFRFGMTKVYSGIPPPFWKTSDLGWPKFTPEYPPHFGKLQIWDDQSLLRNTPPILENFRFGMTKVNSGIPPHFRKLQIWDDQSLLWNTPSPENTESYYMWRLYPTRITTSLSIAARFTTCTTDLLEIKKLSEATICFIKCDVDINH